MRGRDDFDITCDPPPDLAIEIDITSSSIDQLQLYAALGVPEVWLYNGKRLRIYGRQDTGHYAEQSRSPALPLLPPEIVEKFLNDRNQVDETTWIRRFHDWARTVNRAAS